MFQRFHQRDKRRHAWYYRSCAVGLRDELGETDAWRELSALVERVFSGVESLAPDEAALPRGDERMSEFPNKNRETVDKIRRFLYKRLVQRRLHRETRCGRVYHGGFCRFLL